MLVLKSSAFRPQFKPSIRNNVLSFPYEEIVQKLTIFAHIKESAFLAAMEALYGTMSVGLSVCLSVTTNFL